MITAEEARRRAALIIARIKAGEEPLPEPLVAKLAGGPTVAALAARYLEDHVAARCKPRTAASYRLAIDKHILPALGRLPALAVGQAQATELHYALRDTPVMANQVVDVLSRIFNAAEDWGLVAEGSNPCRFVVKYRERKRERFLTEDEFRRLGRVLADAVTCRGVSAHAVVAIRLLMLTGCRRNEILTLRWDEVELAANELRLSDSKTGARTILLSPEAGAVLADIPRVPDKPFRHSGQDQGYAHAQPERPLGHRP